MHRESRSLAVAALLALPVLLSASQAPRDHVRAFNQWADQWAGERAERMQELRWQTAQDKKRQQERERRLESRLDAIQD
jgi:catechol-2,3-dioxygenase